MYGHSCMSFRHFCCGRNSHDFLFASLDKVFLPEFFQSIQDQILLMSGLFMSSCEGAKSNSNKTVVSLECVPFYIEHVNVYLNFEFYEYFCENSRYGLAFLTEIDLFCLVCETVITLSPCIIRSLLHERISKS